MIFIKTFKGYEDKTAALDAEVNEWIARNAPEIVDIKTVLGHENGSRTGSGDVLYTARDATKTDKSQTPPMIEAYDRANQKLWDIAVDGSGDLIQAGSRLYAAGKEAITAIN
ncbi:MAG TPA: hypothetical protein PKZ25_05715, partial [Candidatus Hydrogenedentes bacterium]|nr:hypothetical protein [Candidatus Hydrogenedentota bacterium]